MVRIAQVLRCELKIYLQPKDLREKWEIAQEPNRLIDINKQVLPDSFNEFSRKIYQIKNSNELSLAA